MHAHVQCNVVLTVVPCCCALLLLLLQVDDLRGSPLSVGSLEEIIDEK
jgi:hypothetical protein